MTDWEKEFDKKFPEVHGRRLPKDIKSFIHQTLKEQREEIIKEVKKLILPDSILIPGLTVNYEERDAYNQALKDVIAMLNSAEKIKGGK